MRSFNAATILRPLPRQTRPMSRETVESFLRRLEKVNGLQDELRQIVRQADHPPAVTISVLTARTAESLAKALPELRLPDSRMSDTHLRRAMPFQWRCLACELCAARHCGDRSRVHVWTMGHDAVCVRHRRWVGDADFFHCDAQLDISSAPVILAANRKHKALVGQFGLLATREAVNSTYELICDLTASSALPRTTDLMTYLAGREFNQTSRFANYVVAARYPAMIGIAATLLQTHFALAPLRQNRRRWQLVQQKMAEAICPDFGISGRTRNRVQSWACSVGWSIWI